MSVVIAKGLTKALKEIKQKILKIKKEDPSQISTSRGPKTENFNFRGKRGSELESLIRQYAQNQDTIKKIKSGKFNIISSQYGVSFKNQKIKNNFYKDIEDSFNIAYHKEPEKLSMRGLTKKYKFRDAKDFQDAQQLVLKDIIKKKKYSNLTPDDIIKNRGRAVPLEGETRVSTLDSLSGSGAGLTSTQLRNLRLAKQGSDLDTAHLGPKGVVDDVNIEKTLEDFGFQPSFINQKIIRPAENVRDQIQEKQKEILKGILKSRYDVKLKKTTFSGFKKGILDSEIEIARKQINNLNNDLEIIKIATGNQVTGNKINPLDFQPLSFMGGGKLPLGSMSQTLKLDPVPVRNLTAKEMDTVIKEMGESVPILEDSSVKFLNELKGVLRNPKYIKQVEDYNYGKFNNENMLQTMGAEGREFYKQKLKSKDFSKLPGIDYPVGSKDYGTTFYKDGGRVEMDEGGTAFDALIKQNQEEHGMELKDAIDEAVKEFFGIESFADGGRVGFSNGGIAISPQRKIGGGESRTIGGPTNKVGTIESMLAGIGAGLIDIPRGAFVLGSALMDMGLGTNNAAKVEKWFDELTNLDEKAEATTIGGMVRLLTNLGIPGATAFNMGTKATKAALLAKRNGNYFRITDPKVEERMKTALNGKGRLYATLGGAGAAGVSDAIFIGDVNKAGTLGDMFGGPTQLNENDANEASKEVMNRIKFGLDSSLMMGVIGGTGSAIKQAGKRRNDLASDNDALDRFLSKIRPRGDKPQEFFEMERANIGARAGDVNYAGEVARSLDKHMDGIFPFVVNPFNKMGNDGRKEFMKELNDVLLSGKPEIGVTGRFDFGELDPDMVKSLTAKMKAKGAKQSDIDGVFKEFYNIRGGWGHMFSRLGAKMDKANLDEFRTLFSNKFSNYLGSTYEIFQNKSIIPMLNYRPSEEAVNKAINYV